jgi:hypothetical protein
LPDGRIEDRLVAALNRRPLRRGVPPNPIGVDASVERSVTAAAYEEPAAAAKRPVRKADQ